MRASVTLSASSRRKGLSNNLGENNCFLNVIIQSLWHVRSCRVLITMGDHAVHHQRRQPEKKLTSAAVGPSSTPCLLCELEQVFILYQYAEDPVLAVDRVRVALGDTFALGAMNDATETLETILDVLHYDTFNRMLALRRSGKDASVDSLATDLSQSTMEDASSIICEPQCVAHLLFQMNLMELKSCAKCGETTEPLMNTDFLYRVYAHELLQHAKRKTLEEVLHLEAQGAYGLEDGGGARCDSCKTGKMQLGRWILTLPMVFAISIIWSSDQVTKSEVRSWMDLLSSQSASKTKGSSQSLDLGKIFRLDQSQTSADYSFRGMVCYYGRHYVGFFASHTIEDGVTYERWFLFDDTRVKRVGTWEDVRSRVERGGYQPTLLFYERQDIDQQKLEKTAAEIHQWWKGMAEEEEKEATQAEEKECSSAPVKPIETTKTALAPSQRPPRSVPMSPINTEAYAKQAPMSMPAAGANGARVNAPPSSWWHDTDLHAMHNSAKDTLSKLESILGKGTAPPVSLTSDGMRMSMRRPREYSTHHLNLAAEKEINPDLIFMDFEESIANPTPSIASSKPPPKPPVQPVKTTAIAPLPASSPLHVFDVELSAADGGLGLVLAEAEDSPSKDATTSDASARLFVVTGFEANAVGEKLAAQASGTIEKGDVLVGINDQAVGKQTLYEVLERLWTAPNPVRLQFQRRQQWTCSLCTLVNEPSVSSCAACGQAATSSRK